MAPYTRSKKATYTGSLAVFALQQPPIMERIIHMLMKNGVEEFRSCKCDLVAMSVALRGETDAKDMIRERICYIWEFEEFLVSMSFLYEYGDEIRVTKKMHKYIDTLVDTKEHISNTIFDYFVDVLLQRFRRIALHSVRSSGLSRLELRLRQLYT